MTGAGSGLGAGIARRFAEEGAHVVLADLNGVNADHHAEEIRQGQAKAIAVEMDVTDYDAAGDLMARTVDEYGTIDIPVNGAGTSRQMTFLDAKPEDFQAIMKVNLEGTMYCGQLRGPRDGRKGVRTDRQHRLHLRRARWDRTNRIRRLQICVIGLTKQMALELGPEGVTVNAVGPGPVDTPQDTSCTFRRNPARLPRSDSRRTLR